MAVPVGSSKLHRLLVAVAVGVFAGCAHYIAPARKLWVDVALPGGASVGMIEVAQHPEGEGQSSLFVPLESYLGASDKQGRSVPGLRLCAWNEGEGAKVRVDASTRIPVGSDGNSTRAPITVDVQLGEYFVELGETVEVADMFSLGIAPLRLTCADTKP